MTFKNLYDKNTSISFYEDRYQKGYMDEWPSEKKQRVFEIIKSLSLPVVGDALDFGCGNGVFTDVLKQALPGWQVYGTDISEVAVENASRRYPECHFFAYQDQRYKDKKFDFLFSHHVLEHVFDIKVVCVEIVDYLHPNASMLHILPCGNAGSLERTICEIRTDGIDESVEGRFFYEDTGHLRRLNTTQLTALFQPYGFKLNQQLYANQYYGAIEWIIDYGKDFILQLTDLAKATNEHNRNSLFRIQRKLLRIHKYLQIRKIGYRKYIVGASVNLRHLAKAPFKSVNYALALIIVYYYKYQAKREWQKSKHKATGSEMYIHYIK